MRSLLRKLENRIILFRALNYVLRGMAETYRRTLVGLRVFLSSKPWDRSVHFLQLNSNPQHSFALSKVGSKSQLFPPSVLLKRSCFLARICILSGAANWRWSLSSTLVPYIPPGLVPFLKGPRFLVRAKRVPRPCCSP
jgi:hypothetical protein